jgi:hypothetical protein
MHSRFLAISKTNLVAACVLFCAGCAQEMLGDRAASSTFDLSSVHKYVFVIAMENHDASELYGNTTDAPYINDTLMAEYAYATEFGDELPSLASEPHYVWMEAGTNAFRDHTFTTDDAPSRSNSTGSKSHLVTQIKNANLGLTWMSYQEGIDATSGSCPIAASGFYQPKHNPFVFFRDVSGTTPAKDNAYCAAHHQDLSSLADDLANGTVANFNFITPNQCHDMHGQDGCPQDNSIRAGDDWLADNLPALIEFANAHDGVIFITWDEGEGSERMPFLAVGPHVKPGYAGAVQYDHGSMLKTIEQVFTLPVLRSVSSATALDDLFSDGTFP